MHHENPNQKGHINVYRLARFLVGLQNRAPVVRKGPTFSCGELTVTRYKIGGLPGNLRYFADSLITRPDLTNAGLWLPAIKHSTIGALASSSSERSAYS